MAKPRRRRNALFMKAEVSRWHKTWLGKSERGERDREPLFWMKGRRITRTEKGRSELSMKDKVSKKGERGRGIPDGLFKIYRGSFFFFPLSDSLSVNPRGKGQYYHKNKFRFWCNLWHWPRKNRTSRQHDLKTCTVSSQWNSIFREKTSCFHQAEQILHFY